MIRSARFARFERADFLLQPERAGAAERRHFEGGFRGQSLRVAADDFLQLGREVHLFEHIEIVVAARGSVRYPGRR